ncbi:MAG: neutral zinc metallopeptidase [Beijerinckiaceae bacterium]
MRWEDFRRSDNVEDRRGEDYASDPQGGFMPGSSIVGAGHLGLGAIVVLGIIGYALGIDPRLLIGGAEVLQNARQTSQYNQTMPQSRPAQHAAQPDQLGNFIAAVLAETEDVWSEVLPAQKGIKYIAPHLVRYSGQIRSGCGNARAAMGPFYCPVDQKVYLDTSFFADMQKRFGGGGDFAYAYVIAHEVGHHVQDQLGILGKVEAAEHNASTTRAQANAYSVRLELMADCLAGVWAANAQAKFHILEPGDIEKAVNTAQAIGDDRLQRASRDEIVPDSFTHGTSAQRVQWLNIGLKSGQIDSCNTFAR